MVLVRLPQSDFPFYSEIWIAFVFMLHSVMLQRLPVYIVNYSWLTVIQIFPFKPINKFLGYLLNSNDSTRLNPKFDISSQLLNFFSPQIQEQMVQHSPSNQWLTLSFLLFHALSSSVNRGHLRFEGEVVVPDVLQLFLKKWNPLQTVHLFQVS